MPIALLGGWDLSLKNRIFVHFGPFLGLYSFFSKTARYFAQSRTYANPDSLRVVTRTRGFFPFPHFRPFHELNIQSEIY